MRRGRRAMISTALRITATLALIILRLFRRFEPGVPFGLFR